MNSIDEMARYYASVDMGLQALPVLPVMYRPATYYNFSTKHWTNFPTAETPYAPPDNLVVTTGVSALWEIKPVE